MNVYFTILAVEKIAMGILLFMFIVFWIVVIIINSKGGK